MRKLGRRLSFALDLDSSGPLVPDMSYTVPDYRAAALFVGPTTGRAFFGTWPPDVSFDDVALFVSPPGPIVDGVAPRFGYAGGGTAVTLTGSGFASGGPVLVLFGAVAATGVTVVSDTTITCTTPANVTGHADVTVARHGLGKLRHGRRRPRR